MQPFETPYEIELANIILFANYGFDLEAICPKDRNRDAAIYRQAVQATLLRYTRLSEYAIGYFTGKRHHASVIHSESIITRQEYIYKKWGIESEQLKIYNNFCRYFVDMLGRTENVCRNQRINRSVMLHGVGYDNFGVRLYV